MWRSVKISLKFATAKKLRRLAHLTRRLRKLTQRYINFIWISGGRLAAATLNAVPCLCLSYRQRSDCLKYALDIITSCRASAKTLSTEPGKPVIGKTFKFSSLTATIELGKGSFDYVLKISGVRAGKRIALPFKSHKRLNHWLSKPGARLLDGCIIRGCEAILWIDLPDLPTKDDGGSLGLDIGYNKLLADSAGKMYGTRIKELCEKVRRKKPGSKGKQRACRERYQYISETARLLPWDRIKLIGVEQLKNLKRGKKPNRNKAFRKRMAPWSYRQVIERIRHLAAENRVALHFVDPRNTSRECSVCKSVFSENRQGEKFCCVRCGYAVDADTNGAQNIIARTCRNSRQSMVAESSEVQLPLF